LHCIAQRRTKNLGRTRQSEKLLDFCFKGLLLTSGIGHFLKRIGCTTNLSLCGFKHIAHFTGLFLCSISRLSNRF
jgi:hypothetical protein